MQERSLDTIFDNTLEIYPRILIQTFLPIALFFSCNSAKAISLDLSKPAGLETLLLQEIGGGSSAGGGSPTSPSVDCRTNGPCYIFETGGEVSLSHSGAFGGISGADSFCSTAAGLYLPSGAGDSSEYKALIMDESGTRDLNHDWVIHPNTNYINPSTGLIISASNSSGILSLPEANLFPFSGSQVYTGINASGSTWIPKTNATCNNWTVGTNTRLGEIGETGSPNYVDSSATLTCDTARGIYCVRF